MCSGIEFHAAGPACEKARSLNLITHHRHHLLSSSFDLRTSLLADGKFLLNHGQIIIYLYTKQKLNTKPNAIDYGKCSIE